MRTSDRIGRHRRNLMRAAFVTAVAVVAITVAAAMPPDPGGDAPEPEARRVPVHDATAVDGDDTGVGGQRAEGDPPGFFPHPLNWLNYYLVLGYINLLRFMMRTTAILPWQVSDVASDMSETVAAITWTSYVVFVMAAGLITLTYQSLQSQYGAAQLLPRLVIGLAAASLGPWMLSEVARIANALIKALGDYKEANVDDILEEANKTADITAMVLAAVTFMLLAVLVFHAATRMAVALLLYVFAPAALACHALPYTEPLAQLWWRMLLATVASAIGQTAMLLMWFYAATGTEKGLLGLQVSPSQALSPAQFIKNMMIIVFAFCVHKVHVFSYRWAGKTDGGGAARTVKAVVAAVVMRSVHPLAAAATGASGGRHRGGGNQQVTSARHGAPAKQPRRDTAPAGTRQQLDAPETDPDHPNRPRVNLDAIRRADPYHPQKRRPKPRRRPQRLVVDRDYDDGRNRTTKRAAPPELPTYPRPPAARPTPTPQPRPLRSPHLWRGPARGTPSPPQTTPPAHPGGGKGQS